MVAIGVGCGYVAYFSELAVPWTVGTVVVSWIGRVGTAMVGIVACVGTAWAWWCRIWVSFSIGRWCCWWSFTAVV